MPLIAILSYQIDTSVSVKGNKVLNKNYIKEQKPTIYHQK